MEKIKMVTPLVEMDGDEMTRILWGMIKDQLILPFVDLKTEYYDLGLLHRNETQDQVTVDAANATRRLGVAVKCATITPNKQRMEEYPQLTQMWKSPNGTIRSILDGTVFRAPILIDSIHPVVKNWKKPITIARHAYGDVYKSVDMYTTEPGECTMTFRGESGEEKTLLVQKVDGPAVWQAPTTRKRASAPSPGPASSTPSTPARTCGSPPRTPSPRSTTVSSRRCSRRSSRAIRPSSTSWVSPISIP